ncbi:hypothetical protein [Microbacterium atlanticum]|uniref:hypothetical protein n=1 Tax=Microbacterium atlanticum TaxID=2782168 RepID=UPI0018880C65|nr:hypothetical protein [Microbacterium atlanticum]
MERDRSESDLPEGVIDADPQGGWEQVDDTASQERSAATTEGDLLTDAALQPDDPVEGEAARQGADPDLASDQQRGEEP